MSDILATIQKEYQGLSPQLQVAARYMLSSPDDVAVYSMREIAGRAFVTPATMVRLSSKLGFEKYNDLRDRFRQLVSRPASGYAARARKLQLEQGGLSSEGLLGTLLSAEKDNLQTTFGNMDERLLGDAAATLVNADRVHMIGLRKCNGIVSFFKYATRVFFPSARMITGAAGQFIEELTEIGPDDVLLAVAFDPYTRETVEAVRFAHTAGAKIIAITDSPVSPLAENAAHLFIVGNRSPSFYRSLSGALITVQALVAAIVTRLGDEAIDALEKSDQRLREAETYWQG
ncbi:MurR/RpiR family transcriptional regulator [Sneathiella limimaris]|uniref:MurR/RpiR family transcriptional regulator n=1 Tax=Sneathiella limimaris TaxID=1964213 RepID=UPI00146F6664|nr:MurR/RpiR family transcriptional regulator [Sneathiella limimaris]